MHFVYYRSLTPLYKLLILSNADFFHLHFSSQMGAMKIGSPPAGIYPTDTPDQVVYKLDHSDSKVRALAGCRAQASQSSRCSSR